MPISSRIVQMTDCHGLPFGGGHFPSGPGRFLFHALLGELGDLVGERLEFGSNRQCHFAGNPDRFLIQLGNPRGGVGPRPPQRRLHREPLRSVGLPFA